MFTKLHSILFVSIMIRLFFIIDTYASDPLQINFDTPIKGSIDSHGEKDYYVFEGSSGDRILAWLKPSGFSETTLRLYAPDGSLLAENNAGRGTSNLIEYTKLAQSGRYVVEVFETEGDETFTYDLSIQSWQNNYENAEAIGFDVPQQDTISPSVDRDYYVFEGSSGDRILAWLKPSGFSESTLRLYAPDGSLLAENSTESGAPNLIEYARLTQSGRYMLEVFETEGDETFTYDLSIQSWWHTYGTTCRKLKIDLIDTPDSIIVGSNLNIKWNIENVDSLTLTAINLIDVVSSTTKLFSQ